MKQMKNVKKLKGPMQKVTKGLKKFDDIQDRVTTVADGVTDGITAMTDLTEAVSGVILAGNMHGSMRMCFAATRINLWMGTCCVDSFRWWICAGTSCICAGTIPSSLRPYQGTHCSSRV